VPPVVVEVISWPSSGGNSTPNDEEPKLHTFHTSDILLFHLMYLRLQGNPLCSGDFFDFLRWMTS
ncbi:hypothetical protein, partial [Vreelandella aquamarina]|uniref:hypothetical protein n=1 Tax=Vreelandella aquamarina TaxID=77097 RepID=UPI0023599B2A